MVLLPTIVAAVAEAEGREAEPLLKEEMEGSRVIELVLDVAEIVWPPAAPLAA